MIVVCPCCGNKVAVNGLGRKAFDMPVKNVCDALSKHHSVTLAAQSLGCSRALVYKLLKSAGLTAREVVSR